MAFQLRKPDTAFRDGTGRKQKRPREKDRNYLAWLHELPCVVTGRRGEGVQAAHVRFGDRSLGKPMTGGAQKPDDKWCLPLWHEEHARQHSMKETVYWRKVGIDPLVTCLALWAAYPSIETAELIIAHARKE